MSPQGRPARIFCPVCSARFLPDRGTVSEGDVVICPVCGQRLIVRSEGGDWIGEREAKLTDEEILARVDEYAKIRGYRFNEMKEEIIEGLMGKRDRFGDFYCPCRMEHSNEYQCPCRPTRGGEVERLGRCHCGLFWKN